MTTQKNGGSEALSEPFFLCYGAAEIKNKNFFQKNPKVFETPADIYIRYKHTTAYVC